MVEVPAEQASAETTPASGPCAVPRAASPHPLVDDFEDGNGQAFKVVQRDAWWWSSSDGTPTSVLSPVAGQFKPALRGDAIEGSAQSLPNAFAAHFEARGQSSWGANWGTTLRWMEGGLKCPFNGSAFAGVRFAARGTGQVMFQISMPTTTPVDQELGECKQGCWDQYTYVIHLHPEWRTHIVPFESLQQRGFGTDVPFDPSRLLGVMFQAGPEMLPADFWVDDISFVTREEIPPKPPMPPLATEAPR